QASSACLCLAAVATRSPPLPRLRRPPPSPLFPYTTLFRSKFAQRGFPLSGLNFLLPCKPFFVVGFLHAMQGAVDPYGRYGRNDRSEEHTSELQSRENLVCRLLLEKKKNTDKDPACATWTMW